MKRKSLEEIDRKDVLAFIQLMREAKQSPRTIANRVSYLKTFFHHFGHNSPLLKTESQVHGEGSHRVHPRGAEGALCGSRQEENDLFQFFLWTGARDGEVQHATWPDLSFSRKTYTIKERLDLGFIPKDKEEGSIPRPITINPLSLSITLKAIATALDHSHA